MAKEGAFVREITEKDGVHEEWFVDARKQTEATLPEFVRHLAHDFVHDYGTICHAVAAAAIAAASAVDHDAEQGGITGFQAGAVMWRFVQHWLQEKGPLRLVRYEHMLFPQYEDEFAKTIEPDVWKFLQEGAAKNLKDHDKRFTSPEVVAHWKAIVDGVVPFGFVVKGT